MDTKTCLLILLILALEWAGDFLLQNRDTALRKSQEIKKLIEHVFLLSIPISFAGWIFDLDPIQWMYFLWANAFIHAVVDWNIWKGYKYLVYKRIQKHVYNVVYNSNSIAKDRNYDKMLERKLQEFQDNKEYAEDTLFYSFIGLDRFLHVSTIIILYKVLL